MPIVIFVIEIGMLLFGAFAVFYVYLKKQSYRSILVSSFFNYFVWCYLSLLLNFFLKYLTYLAFIRNNGVIVGTPYAIYSHILSALYVFIAAGSVYYFIVFCRLLVKDSALRFSFFQLHVPVAVTTAGVIYVFYFQYLIRYNADEKMFKYLVLASFLVSMIEMYCALVTAIQSRAIHDTKKKKAVLLFGLLYSVWDLIGFVYLLTIENIQFFIFDYAIRFGAVVLMGNIFLKTYFTTQTTRVIDEDTIKKAVRCYDLSEKQIAVVMHVFSGKTNKEIAWELATTERTIKYHMKTIFDKVGVTSRMELIHKIHL